MGNTFQPILGHASTVITGAASQYQYRINISKYFGSQAFGNARWVVKQLGHYALYALQSIGNGTGLLENFFLHVVAVRPKLSRPAVGVHRQHLTLYRLVRGIKHLKAVQLHIHHIAFGQVQNLIGHAGQCHGVAGQKVFALAFAKNKRRASTRTNDAVRFVLGHHRNSECAA